MLYKSFNFLSVNKIQIWRRIVGFGKVQDFSSIFEIGLWNFKKWLNGLLRSWFLFNEYKVRWKVHLLRKISPTCVIQPRKNSELVRVHEVNYLMDQIPDKHHCSRRNAIDHIFVALQENVKLVLDSIFVSKTLGVQEAVPPPFQSSSPLLKNSAWILTKTYYSTPNLTIYWW